MGYLCRLPVMSYRPYYPAFLWRHDYITDKSVTCQVSSNCECAGNSSDKLKEFQVELRSCRVPTTLCNKGTAYATMIHPNRFCKRPTGLGNTHDKWALPQQNLPMMPICAEQENAAVFCDMITRLNAIHKTGGEQDEYSI